MSEVLDGTLWLTFGAHLLAWTDISTRPLKRKPTIPQPAPIKPPEIPMRHFYLRPTWRTLNMKDTQLDGFYHAG